MSVPRIKLEAVRRKSGGRIHLTPRVPRTGPVTTLCGQTLAEGTYAAFDGEADCANCIRRSKDQARISGAFFDQEEGGELLRLSLEQARARRPATREEPPAMPEKPVAWPSPKPPLRCRDRLSRASRRHLALIGTESLLFSFRSC